MKTDVSFRSDLQNYDKFINELFSRKKKKERRKFSIHSKKEEIVKSKKKKNISSFPPMI